MFGGTVGLAALLHVVTATGGHPLVGRVQPLLAAVTAGLAAVASLLCLLSSRLRADGEMRVVGYAWGIYALVVMPISVVTAAPGTHTAVLGAATVGNAVFMVVLMLSFTHAGPRWLSGPAVLTGGVMATVVITATAVVLPSGVTDVLVSSIVERGALLGWGLLACACVTRGLRRRDPVWHRLGFGLALITAAHTLLLSGTATGVFAVLRLVGFLALVAAVGLHTRTIARRRRAADDAAAAQAAAEQRAEAERRHEMRNALATLSSVTTLLGPRPDAPPEVHGRSVTTLVDAEFARLRGLLENAESFEDEPTAIEVVLSRLVTLRRAAGYKITLDCSDRMMTNMPAASLAQVLTNLLANCASHAAGADIYVGARRTGTGCVVEVTDAGPGPDSVPSPAGSGMGLALSIRLVEAAGGALRLRPASRFPTGTTVLLHLPAPDPISQLPRVSSRRTGAS